MDIPYFLVCLVVGSFFMVVAGLLLWFLVLVFGFHGLGLMALSLVGIIIASLIGSAVLQKAWDRRGR